MKEEICQCSEIMENFSGRKGNYIHLSGCPESEWAKEYNNLKWWQKLSGNNPRKIYNIHKSQITNRNLLTP